MKLFNRTKDEDFVEGETKEMNSHQEHESDWKEMTPENWQQAAFDIKKQLKKIQDNLVFLERKVDALLDSKDGGDRRPRYFNKDRDNFSRGGDRGNFSGPRRSHGGFNNRPPRSNDGGGRNDSQTRWKTY